MLLPTKNKVIKIKASNIRSCAFTNQGEIWYWGGRRFCDYEKPEATFRLLNEETQVKEMKSKNGEKLVDFEMGYGHDVLLTEC